MAWPVEDGWNQHLDELNARNYSRPLKVALVRVEEPFEESWNHVKHVHPYWQMALVFGKSFSVDVEGKTLSPDAGDILIIPPQNWHYFDLTHGKKAWTIKFVLEGVEEKFESCIIAKSDETILLARWLNEVMDKSRNSGTSNYVLMEHLIAAILDLHFFNRDIHGKELDIVKKARLFIEKNLQCGKKVRVEDISTSLGYTSTYLTRIFKNQLGIPLKVYIDQQRLDMAKKLLAYSELNISEIADEMGFQDVFRFSRFFKRMSGESPREFRKR